MRKTIFYNARIYPQLDNLTANSMVISGNRIVAIGDDLHRSDEFRSFSKINLNGKTVVPGLVDAHTHFYYFALTFGIVDLNGLDSIDKCLSKIKTFATKLDKNEWIVGSGYAPDRFKQRIEPDKIQLDNISGRRPAFIFSKDQHSAWVNSKTIELAGINKSTPDPAGGRIERLYDGTPSGILREGPAYKRIHDLIPEPSKSKVTKYYNLALEHAYRNGVTGVHSVDSSPRAFEWFTELAEKNNLGLRINYYFPSAQAANLSRKTIRFGSGNEFLRVAGIKIFSDGSLGSQTALCFSKYIGSKNNYGIEVKSVSEMRAEVTAAAHLGLPAAIHAIGDKAVANVLDVFEEAPKLSNGARHRIEHLQLCRRRDIARLKKLNVVASMQPSHCPSDIKMVRKYWGKRGADAYIFRTLIDKGVDLAFGSDVPIEPLDPIAGIAAAVRRARPNSHDVLHPEQRITAMEALYRFTIGPAIAVGQAHCRGRLLPGYPADFVVLSDDITKVSANRIYDVKVLATVLDGEVKFAASGMKLP
ncbi:MAG: amidohydrolase [Candidatus Zixiibacteriota bacterium]